MSGMVRSTGMKQSFAAFLALLFLASKCVLAAGPGPGADGSACDSYTMELNLDPSKSELDGTVRLRYRNTTTNSLSSVRLRLDPNLSRKQSLEMVSVTDGNGKPLQWEYQPLKFANWNSEKGAVEIKLPQTLAPSGEITFSMNIHSTGNHLNPGMVALQDDPYQSLDAWYPKAMTPRADGWSFDDDRLADYSVSIRLPAACTVVSTGRQMTNALKGETRELHLQSEQTRGFTIYASSEWRRHERKAGRVELAVCLPAEAESWAERFLDATADSIDFYEKEYGPFPCGHLDIACPGTLKDRAHGSSAACNVITIFLGEKLEEQHRFLIAHEVAHQYFGVRVGSPRETLGWVTVGLGLTMDEHYTRARNLDATYGRKIMRNFYFRAEKMGFDTTLSQPVEVPMKSPPPWSSGWNMSLTHGKAYAVCVMLRDLVGYAGFQEVTRKLLAAHDGKLIRQEDLIGACEDALGESLDWFTADWIQGRATFDYAITEARKSDDGWDLEVRRVGTGHYPVQVELVTDSGERLRQRMDRTKPTATLHFKTSGSLKAAGINQDGFYPDLDGNNDKWPRKAGKGAK